MKEGNNNNNNNNSDFNRLPLNRPCFAKPTVFSGSKPAGEFGACEMLPEGTGLQCNQSITQTGTKSIFRQAEGHKNLERPIARKPG